MEVKEKKKENNVEELCSIPIIDLVSDILVTSLNSKAQYIVKEFQFKMELEDIKWKISHMYAQKNEI